MSKERRNHSMINYTDELEKKSKTYQLHERIKKAIAAPRISDDYQIIFTVKKKKWKRALRVMKIAILFLHRLRVKVQDLKKYGLSRAMYNPNYRNYKQIRLAMIPTAGNLEKSENFISDGKIINRTRFLFYPNNPGILIWNMANLTFIVYFLTLMLYFIVFNIKARFIDIFESMINVYYIVDLSVNFNLTYMTENGFYEQSRKKIALRYLKSYFTMDLLTSLPIDWILTIYMSSSKSYNKLFRILKLPKLISTLKMAKIFSVTYWLKTLRLGDIWRFRLKVHENLLKTISVMFLTYMVLHIAACIFIAIGSIHSLYPNSWIIHERLQDASNAELYVSSLYYCFVVLTTVGYGDIYSQNKFERLFSMVWMLFGIGFYSYTISFITQFFASSENRNSLLEKRLQLFEKFAKNKHISRDLITRVNNSLEYSSTKISYRWLEGELDVFKSMPLEMRYDFLKELYPELFKCPFFKTNDPSFAVRIIGLLKPVKLRKGEFLWKRDDTSNYIAFITKGDIFMMADNPYYSSFKRADKKKMERSMINRGFLNIKNLWSRVSDRMSSRTQSQDYSFFKSKTPINHISDLLAQPYFAFKLFSLGAYLGEEEIIFQNLRRYHLKAANDCELMILSREDFDNVLKKDFPHIYAKICEIAEKRKNGNMEVKRKVLKLITNTARKQGIALTREYMSKNLNRTLKRLEAQKRSMMDKSLFEFYKDTLYQNPLEEMVKDIHIKEYDPKDLEDELEDMKKDFKQIKSPGLVKIYTDWKSKLISHKEQGDCEGR